MQIRVAVGKPDLSYEALPKQQAALLQAAYARGPTNHASRAMSRHLQSHFSFFREASPTSPTGDG